MAANLNKVTVHSHDSKMDAFKELAKAAAQNADAIAAIAEAMAKAPASNQTGIIVYGN